MGHEGGKTVITISLCMIVKNEERVLARCLDTVADLVDEVIVVDTGSTDSTKQIASKYTDKIYDFQWIDDFSAARNFAFSKATKEYIYSADADEVLDEENRQRFRLLKENLLPEIEMVQMYYGNQLQFGTVYNFDEELRPKLFKRVRNFVWEEKIHEAVRLEPVIFDSDIVITHMPENNHSGRDLANFRKQTRQGQLLSKRLEEMYARELVMCGTKEDFHAAKDYFLHRLEEANLSQDALIYSCLIVAKAARTQQNLQCFWKYMTKVLVGEGCSEACCELGALYEEQRDLEEAAIWYYNAAFETKPALQLDSGESIPLEGLVRVYEAMGLPETAKEYADILAEKIK